MDHGRILETGTHAQLLDRRGQYYELNTMAFAERGTRAPDTYPTRPADMIA